MSTTPIVYTEDLVPGARNAIRSCLRVQPDEHVTVITDRETEDIATPACSATSRMPTVICVGRSSSILTGWRMGSRLRIGLELRLSGRQRFTMGAFSVTVTGQ